MDALFQIERTLDYTKRQVLLVRASAGEDATAAAYNFCNNSNWSPEAMVANGVALISSEFEQEDNSENFSAPVLVGPSMAGTLKYDSNMAATTVSDFSDEMYKVLRSIANLPGMDAAKQLVDKMVDQMDAESVRAESMIASATPAVARRPKMG
jgi:hypothetical protein